MMGTVRCSDTLGEGGGGEGVCLVGVCPGGICQGGVCQRGVCQGRCTPPPLVNRGVSAWGCVCLRDVSPESVC